MRSIKPGRGPSMMGAVGAIFAAIFGLFWTITALSMGAGIFSLFGVLFIIMALVQVAYNFKNATSENRFSTFDITEDKEETDPLNMQFHKHEDMSADDYTTVNHDGNDTDSNFCPYCGASVQKEYEYCNKCGRKLP
ncbi:MAG TPA: zinc-ribbon domain-containing protein [Mobilitalea sp.]|nr:zinc-ribbon domain-containing protein [Mobilitalea sp.]